MSNEERNSGDEESKDNARKLVQWLGALVVVSAVGLAAGWFREHEQIFVGGGILVVSGFIVLILSALANRPWAAKILQSHADMREKEREDAEKRGIYH